MMGHARQMSAYLKLSTRLLNKVCIFNGILSSTKTGAVESFGEYRALESILAPAPQLCGGEVDPL